ncbi:MAG: MFS transporter [Mariniblastus sp.]|nr:MFS transporter [Mariniblastus sp.]
MPPQTEPGDQSQDVAITPGRRIAILIAAGMSQFLVTVDYSAVAIALPRMANDLHARTIDLQWVITGYILSFSVMLGIAGPLGDRYGRKKILLIGIALFGLISTWLGMADTATNVIIARIALGIGGGLLLPLAASVLADCTPSNQLTKYMALLTAINACGAAAGPVLGGLLTDALSWRWIFYANIPFAALAFTMVLLLARESRNPNAEGKLDFLGIVLLASSLGCLSLGVDRIPSWQPAGWIGMSVLGIVLMIGFVIREIKCSNPIVDVRLLGNRNFTGFTLAGMFSNSCWCLLVFTTTLLLQKVYHLSAFQAGLFFLYLSGSVVVASAAAAKISSKTGVKPLVLMALIFQGAALSLLWWHDDLTVVAICLAGGGVGCAWGWSMPQAGAILTLPRERVGLASGSIMTVMIMGANLVVVICATIIDGTSGASGQNYARGIQISYLMGMGLAVAGILAAVFILPSRSKLKSNADESAGVTA